MLGRMSVVDVVDRVEAKHLLDAVVVAKLDHLGNPPTRGESLDLDDNLDRVAYLCGDVVAVSLLVRSHRQFAEAMQSPKCGTGVDRSHGTRMAGVEGVEQVARLRSSYLAQDDTVGPPAKRAFEQSR